MIGDWIDDLELRATEVRPRSNMQQRLRCSTQLSDHDYCREALKDLVSRESSEESSQAETQAEK